MSVFQFFNANRHVGGFATQCKRSFLAVVLMSAGASVGLAQDAHSHHLGQPQQELTAERRAENSAMIKIIRESTERYQNVENAIADGYEPQFGCVSGDYDAAMGLHYVNSKLVASGVLDVRRPQIIIYEPTPEGGKRLIGVDYLVIAEQWKASHSDAPQIMGQLLHMFPSPNRFNLPDFYTLHVWAWKNNPKGAFVNWHPNVSCESFETRN